MVQLVCKRTVLLYSGTLALWKQLRWIAAAPSFRMHAQADVQDCELCESILRKFFAIAAFMWSCIYVALWARESSRRNSVWTTFAAVMQSEA